MARFLARLAAYCAGTVLVCLVAFPLGVEHFDSTCDPHDPEVTECDLGAVEGFEWSVIAFVGCLVAAGVNEAVLADSRARDRRPRDGQPRDRSRSSTPARRPHDGGESGGPR